MGNSSFDELIQELQSALVKAQDSLRKRSGEAARRMCEEDETGGARSSFLSFAIPQNGTDGDGYEVIPLPVSSFRTNHRLQISMLSLEFACDLKEERLIGASRVYSLAIMPLHDTRSNRKRRRMQIVFHGTDRPSGEARIDGELLMEIPRYGEAGKGRSATQAKRSTFSKLVDLLRNIRRPQRFIMTVEQSKRVSEIVRQLEAETLTRAETATL